MAAEGRLNSVQDMTLPHIGNGLIVLQKLSLFSSLVLGGLSSCRWGPVAVAVGAVAAGFQRGGLSHASYCTAVQRRAGVDAYACASPAAPRGVTDL
eukprot:235761-Chlamydomonas_euryale.AAC.1